MTLAVALMFCVAAVASAVASVAACGELAGGEPAACSRVKSSASRSRGCTFKVPAQMVRF